MRFLTLIFVAVISFNLQAQSGQNLVTHLSFNKNGCAIEDEAGEPGIQTFFQGDSVCTCGVVGNARYFDGDDDWFYLFGQEVEEAFSTIDFSLSFYFKPTSTSASNQAIFSKKVDCTGDQAFVVRYNPASRNLSVELAESPTLSASISRTLPISCWYHVVVVRKSQTTVLYVNNTKLGEVNSPGGLRVDVGNSEPVTVGSSNCNLETNFEGHIDEIRLYSRALSIEEIEDLYFYPDQIATGLKPTGVNDTTIFLGESVSIKLTNSCASSYDWSPTTNVANPNQGTPLITPTETTTYLLTLMDEDACSSNDSIRITVIDPLTIECGDILLPTAFTPNGDGLNDGFGISNIFATGELLTFEIFDRWGNIVFRTDNVRTKWDGFYKGQAVNPGVFLYKVHYKCEGEEYVKSGSVTVIR